MYIFVRGFRAASEKRGWVSCAQLHEPALHSSPKVRESKKVLNSGIPYRDSGFQVLDSSLCQWNLNSGFWSLVGFRTPWALFRIPRPMMPHFTSKHFPYSLTWGHTVETQIQGRSWRRQRRLRVNSSLRTDSRLLTMDSWKAKEYFAVVCLRPAYEYYHVVFVWVVQWRQRNVQIGIVTFYRHQ